MLCRSPRANLGEDLMSTRTTMHRRNLLKLFGAGGVALVAAEAGLWRWVAAHAAPEDAAAATGTSLACVLSPAKTEGPYFVDEKLQRADIRIDPSDNSVQAGVPLQLTIRVFDADRGCAPVRGVAVDVWHANAQGLYSDVGQNGTVGKKYLRGFQTTGADGAVRFTTVYPGWYQGRAVHIHFKVRHYDGASATYEFTSQLFFDESVNDTVMRQAAYRRGRPRDTLNAGDTIYGSDGSRLIASTSGGPSAGYAATFDVGLTGLPAGVSSTVAASLVATRFGRTARGLRRLTLTLDVDEAVSADARLVRGGRTIARRHVALKAGTRKPALVLAEGVAAGSATLVLTLKDAAGNAKVVRRTLRVPSVG
jgi:protocatechuate 3,4-dioxygenase beta subunit